MHLSEQQRCRVSRLNMLKPILGLPRISILEDAVDRFAQVLFQVGLPREYHRWVCNAVIRGNHLSRVPELFKEAILSAIPINGMMKSSTNMHARILVTLLCVKGLTVWILCSSSGLRLPLEYWKRSYCETSWRGSGRMRRTSARRLGIQVIVLPEHAFKVHDTFVLK